MSSHQPRPTPADGLSDADATLEAIPTLFAFLWAGHVLWHYASYFSWFVSPLGFATVCLNVALLLLPRSRGLLAASGYLYFSTWLSHLPNVPNHETLGAFVGLTFTASILWRWAIERGAPQAATRGFVSSLPVVRAIVILMYFWATFHKLNRDFLFDPVNSCGAVFYETFVHRFPFLPAASSLGTLAMAWGTVLIEGIIGLLLLVPRTRNLGVVVALAFHLFLTLSPKSGFYNFTSLLFPLLLVFASPEVWRRFLDLVRPERWRWLPNAVAAVALALAPFVLLDRFSVAATVENLAASAFRERPLLSQIFFAAWMVWSLPLFALLLVALRRARLGPPRLTGEVARAPRALWAIAAVFFLWGITPYLGLKTENSFAMFSNLRTERQPNHLLVPSAVSWFPYQDDFVQVNSLRGRRADGRPLSGKLARPHYRLPYEGLRSYLRSELRSGATIEQVVFTRGDQKFRVPYSEDGELFSQGLWQHKFLTFRRFRPEGPMTCEH